MCMCVCGGGGEERVEEGVYMCCWLKLKLTCRNSCKGESIIVRSRALEMPFGFFEIFT